MSTKLYIIGNGFDLHHGISSSYGHFKNYVKQNNNQLFQALEKYFDPVQLWSDFEGTLADLDTDRIMEEASNFLVDYGADNWSDAFHHDYQYEINERLKLVTTDLKEIFTEWILSLDIPSSYDSLLKLDREARYLNFNYTPTLSKLYRINIDNIIYIHNEAQDISSNLLLGHGFVPKSPESGQWDEDIDVRIEEGQRFIDDYFLESYKPVREIIENKKSFFDSLINIDEIIVYGHSLAEVDLPYFDEIIKRVNLFNTKWRVSYYSAVEYHEKRETLLNLGVPEKNITIGKLSDFDTNQLLLFI